MALFDLREKPHENKNFNFVDDFECRERVNQMHQEYLDILNSRRRTVPSILTIEASDEK